MSNTKFKVGDYVKYDKYIGEIIKIIDSSYYSIKFGQDFATRYGLPRIYNDFSDVHLRKAKPPLTKEELLLQKCKYLWNESKYVKNNPQRAY